MLRDGCSYIRKGLALFKLRQLPHGLGIIVRIGFQGGTETVVKLFPAGGKNGLALGGKLFPGTSECGGDSLIDMRPGHGTQHLIADQRHQLSFTLGQPVKALLHKFSGGEDSVVVGHLFAVQDAVILRGSVLAFGERHQPPQAGHKAFGHRQHIIGQILAVRSRIGQQLLFVQCLCVIKGLFGGKAKDPVGLPLQGGQVIELGRLLRLFLPRHGNTNGLRSGTGRLDGVCFASIRKAAAYCVRVAYTDMDDVIFLFLEIRDLGVALHQQIQGRCLDAAHGQGLVVQHGEKPGGVDAHQPIGFRPAQGRLIQRVIVRSRFQVCKAVPDGAVLHTGNPEALERLLTACHLIDETENEFTLAPGVSGANQAGHVGVLHQGAQNVKLLLFLVGDDVLPHFWEDRQILIAPFFETLVISASVGKGHQMPNAPAHQIAVSLQISVVLFRSPDHARNAAGDSRFFCNYKLHK